MNTDSEWRIISEGAEMADGVFGTANLRSWALIFRKKAERWGQENDGGGCEACDLNPIFVASCLCGDGSRIRPEHHKATKAQRDHKEES